MNSECPFCLGRNIVEVAAGGNGRSVDYLMLCEECERWFWASDGEEVPDLSRVCQTVIREPQKCIEEILHPLRSGFWSSPRQKTVELNLLCSACDHRCFFLPGIRRSVQLRRAAPESAGAGPVCGKVL
jgi:hypothetical protein